MKKKYLTILLVLTLGIIGLTVLGSSYALWSKTDVQEQTNTFDVACFKIEFENSSNINLTNAYPMSDQKGLTQEPYTFTITNVCEEGDLRSKVEVQLDVLSKSTMPLQFIKVALEKDSSLTTKYLKEYESLSVATENVSSVSNSYLLFNDKINPKESKTYSIYMWLGEDADNSAMKKELSVIIKTRNSQSVSPVYIAGASCDKGANANANYKINGISIYNYNNDKCKLEYDRYDNKELLSEHIINLAQTPTDDFDWVNNGMVIEEHGFSEPSGEYITLNYDDYLDVNDVSGMFEFANGMWTSKITTSRWDPYDLEFSPSKEGHYQICYNVPNNSNNQLKYIINQTPGDSNFITINGAKEGCDDIGIMNRNSKMKVSVKYNSQNSSFYLKYSPIHAISSEYRYEGKKVDNYVWFNNELWRIIGVFDNAGHGIDGKNLVKIMRANSIGALSWDSRGNSTYDFNWEKASLNTLLNEYYYKQRNNDSVLGNVSQYCRTYSSSNVLGLCDYSVTGISDIYRNMIEENAKWYLKGFNTRYITSKEHFDYERNGNKKADNYPDYVEKPIGLIYASDFGYSSGKRCTNTALASFDRGCANYSWIYNGYDWTISSSAASGIYQIDIAGSASYLQFTYYGLPVRPTVYLKSNTYVYHGDGSINNPYIIGVDE